MKIRKLIDSFNYAISGLIYALKTQKNMKIHFLIGTIVIFISLFVDFSRIEILILGITICLVIITELINTAIESTIDLYTKEHSPLAKIAKDVAAGAVLVAAVNSIFVAYVLFFDRIQPFAKTVFIKVQQSSGHLTFVSLILVIVVVIAMKSKFSKNGTYLLGGMPSGHSALSFSAATAIAFISKDIVIAILGYFLAITISQSRIEGKIHTPLEVIVGAVVGTLVTLLIFQMFL
ncbi:diacylglycerol kinase [Garciella nitratireducens]|uniref:Diacylglycerol kinase (ATP) n=1 Tax=Garciella nitratireducens DSM 15102 TaxID=1121911 RepID=A0A1T4JRN2_9FIRM|nr:diacylglycerol kinase [Garciella nitratireducens]RBP45502.1 diacylglycerol kinase (ATP) [Garciella nitratireducens]SJZ32793.1 diacylglycerol kinase (ATP) [Garciella nitratireducens DSM 15102]